MGLMVRTTPPEETRNQWQAGISVLILTGCIVVIESAGGQTGQHDGASRPSIDSLTLN